MLHKDITLVTRMANKGLSPIDLLGSASQVAEKWRKWKRAFEYYAEGEGIDNARKKTSQLLHFAGMGVQDIFEDLQDPGNIPESGDNAFKIAIHTFVWRKTYRTSATFFANWHRRKRRPLISLWFA